MKPCHINIKGFARAYVKPKGLIQRLILFSRGWRPFESICVSKGLWWSKPNSKQALVEKGI